MIASQLIDLHNKRPATGEIIVTLFELCNLSCLFCPQDHSSIEGIDTIVSKIDQIKSVIDTLLKKGKKDFSIHLMGGELFSDELDDSVFEDYKTLIDSINTYCIEQNIPVNISVVSNLVWKKKNRVKQFLADTNVSIMTSYDPSGRFDKNSLEIFKENVVEFKDNIVTVNVIITKPTIDKFLKNQIPFFDYLYENFSVYFDQYGPEKNQKFLMATDIQVRDFMIYLVDHWPRVLPVQDYFSKTKSQMTCMDTHTVMPAGKWGGCGQFEQIDKVIPIKLVTEQSWLDGYNCLECEHFNRCSLGCFMSNHVRDMRTQKECWLKEVYDYVDNKMIGI
jgi:organic radical activating enzyme